MMTVRDFAHARAGDKGHSVNVNYPGAEPRREKRAFILPRSFFRDRKVLSI